MIDRSTHFKWPSSEFALVIGTGSPHWERTGERIAIGDTVPDLATLKEWSARELAKHGIAVAGAYSKPDALKVSSQFDVGAAPRIADGSLYPRRIVYTMAETTHESVERAVAEMAREIVLTYGPGRLFANGGDFWPFGYLVKRDSVRGVADVRRMCVNPCCKNLMLNSPAEECRFDSEPRVLMGGYYVHIPTNQVSHE